MSQIFGKKNIRTGTINASERQNDLIGDISEKKMISNERENAKKMVESGSLMQSSLYEHQASQSLFDLLGFFNGKYTILLDSKNQRLAFAYSSKIILSTVEVDILEDRLRMAYGHLVNEFIIYQEPSKGQTLDDYINSRDSSASGDDLDNSLYREVGVIRRFKSFKKSDQLNYDYSDTNEQDGKIIDVHKKVLKTRLKEAINEELKERDMEEKVDSFKVKSARITDAILYIDLVSYDKAIGRMLRHLDSSFYTEDLLGGKEIKKVSVKTLSPDDY